MLCHKQALPAADFWFCLKIRLFHVLYPSCITFWTVDIIFSCYLLTYYFTSVFISFCQQFVFAFENRFIGLAFAELLCLLMSLSFSVSVLFVEVHLWKNSVLMD